MNYLPKWRANMCMKTSRRFCTSKIGLKFQSFCAENFLSETFHDINLLLTTVGYKYDMDSSNNLNIATSLSNSSSSGSSSNSSRVSSSLRHIFTIGKDHSIEVNISPIKQNGYNGMLRKFQNSISKSPAPNVEVQLSELLFTRADSDLAAGIQFNREGAISTCFNHPPPLLTPISSQGSVSTDTKLFEIIIPSHFIQHSSSGNTGSGVTTILDHVGAIPAPKKYPGVYFIPPSSTSTDTDNSVVHHSSPTEAVYIRVFPTRTLTLIIQVPNLLEVKEKLQSLSLSTPLLLESIGGRASYGNPLRANNREQIQLNCSLLYPALDLRITEHAVLSPYFNEDPRAVLEGTIASIQSDRIFGGGGNLLEGKLGGSCWTEFHAMVSERCKQGTQAVLSAVVSSTSSGTTNTNTSATTSTSTTYEPRPRISKAPSIVE